MVLPRDSKIYDIITYSNEKFIFTGCANGVIRVYDYSNTKNIKELPNGIIYSDFINNNKSGNIWILIQQITFFIRSLKMVLFIYGMQSVLLKTKECYWIK